MLWLFDTRKRCLVKIMAHKMRVCEIARFCPPLPTPGGLGRVSMPLSVTLNRPCTCIIHDKFQKVNRFSKIVLDVRRLIFYKRNWHLSAPTLLFTPDQLSLFSGTPSVNALLIHHLAHGQCVLFCGNSFAYVDRVNAFA